MTRVDAAGWLREHAPAYEVAGPEPPLSPAVGPGRADWSWRAVPRGLA